LLSEYGHRQENLVIVEEACGIGGRLEVGWPRKEAARSLEALCNSYEDMSSVPIETDSFDPNPNSSD
jgi:hypothetical protein